MEVIHTNWLQIRTDYISGGGSYRELADKYGASVDAVKRRGAAEGWRAERASFTPELRRKTLEKTAEKVSDNQSEIAAISSGLALTIFRQMEKRLDADELDGPEFRRLVQSYVDMLRAVPNDSNDGQHEAFIKLLAVLDA